MGAQNLQLGYTEIVITSSKLFVHKLLLNVRIFSFYRTMVTFSKVPCKIILGNETTELHMWNGRITRAKAWNNRHLEQL